MATEDAKTSGGRSSEMMLAVTLGLLIFVGLGLLVAGGMFLDVGPMSDNVGMVVVYEVDTDGMPPGFEPGAADIESLVEALDQRLGFKFSKRGIARPLDDGRIEVSIYNDAPSKMQSLADSLQRDGTLEFRILANENDHKPLIEQAREEEGQNVFVDGQLRGRWVPVKKTSEEDFRDHHPECAFREVTHNGKPVLEYLVYIDDFNVTGDYLIHASVGQDYQTNPCVNFEFNTDGSRRFGQLTMGNRPDLSSGFYRKLGIILDGSLRSAPRLQSVITSRGQITGRFTQEEVQETVDALNGGSLPMPIRKVEQRVVGEE